MANVPSTPDRVPTEATEEGDGIVIGGEGAARVDVFVDFLCPFCEQFERRSGRGLARLTDTGEATVVYHPVAFLERLSTAHYSSRASAASGAAADAGGFLAFKDALFARQPEENTPGHSDDELVAIGVQAGLDEATFGATVRDEVYLPWTAYLTSRAVEDGIQGTPTVLVDGAPVAPDIEAIAAAVRAHGR